MGCEWEDYGDYGVGGVGALVFGVIGIIFRILLIITSIVASIMPKSILYTANTVTDPAFPTPPYYNLPSSP